MPKRSLTNAPTNRYEYDNDDNGEYERTVYSSSSNSGTERVHSQANPSSNSSDDHVKQVGHDQSYELRDPFANSNEIYLEEYSKTPPAVSTFTFGYDSNENSETSLTPDINLSTPKRQSTYQDYSGYYSNKYNNNNNLRSHLNNTENSYQQFQSPPQKLLNTPNISHSNSYNDLLSSHPAFDRYPVVGSKFPKPPASFTDLDMKSPFISGSASNVSISNSVLKFQSEGVSPFGGYPASLFPLLLEEKEDDDYFHNPDPEEEARLDKRRFFEDFTHMSKRSFGGWLGVLFLLSGVAVIFIIIPALTFTGAVDHHGVTKGSGDKIGSIDKFLTYYEYPQLAAIRTSLVDPDTPTSANTRTAMDGSSWKLVFSDEFNANGRTFYDGDDQFWTAPDIHYDATKDLEWYCPDAVITKNSTLKLRMDAFQSHNLYYRSGMLQSWNKLCFTQGALEISVNLPNYGKVSGLWPGLWTMGNLGRPGYLASTEGVWPYSYEACDAGITPNQSSPDGISYLPGQKLNSCTCKGEDHPNPGTGRGAPEIDILEAEADTNLGVGVASQSAQIAPFDIWYIPDYDFIEIFNFTTTTMNSYCGGPFQQAVSAVTTLNTTWYEFGPDAGYYQKYSYEYLNDNDDGYIRWFVGDSPTMTINAKAFHPNGNIDWRRISKEPMSIIMNLGISNNWAYIDWQSIYFPVTMSIDYVRLYQPSDAVSLTCDPENYPTYDYIQDHLVAYSNPNLTSWELAGFSYPKNSLTGNCDVAS